MKMTFDEYAKNPMQSRVMNNTRLYDEMYKKKLDLLLLREKGVINYFLFKDSPARYIIYLKIPSEKVKEFYYDVVIEFTTNNPLALASDKLDDYNVRFYSNDPAFVFNFAYSFIQNDMFFKDLETKMSKQARTKPAEKTNKNNEVGYVKSIYFAYLIMKMKGLFYKQTFDTYGRKYAKTTLLQMVQHSNEKFHSRQQMETDQRQDVSRFNKLAKAEPSNITGKAGMTKQSKNIRTTGMAKTVRTTRTTKRI